MRSTSSEAILTMNKIIKYILIFFNVVSALLLLSACLSPLVSPEKVPFLVFWGLIMPYTLILNALFILYWIIKAKFYFVISLLAIVISWPTTRTSFPYNNKSNELSERGVRVMSYNVRVFDRYNWSKDKNNVGDMIKYIKDAKVDILCLQEFGVAVSNKKGVTEGFIINSFKEFPYHYIYYSPKSSSKYFRQGLAIFSRYPISNRFKLGDDGEQRGCSIIADVNVKGRELRIVNTHFQSFRFNNKNDLIKGIDRNNYKIRIKGAVKAINNAAIMHQESAEGIISVKQDSPHSVILCADINNTPISYSYHILSNNLDDAYLHQNTGFGATYNGSYPFLRIDYIFHSEGLSLLKYKRDKVKYSDHFPIIAEFQLVNR